MDVTLHLVCPGRIRPVPNSGGVYIMKVPKHPRVSLRAIGLEVLVERLNEKVRVLRVQVAKDGNLINSTTLRRIEVGKWVPINNESRCIVEASEDGTTLYCGV